MLVTFGFETSSININYEKATPVQRVLKWSSEYMTGGPASGFAHDWMPNMW